MHVGAEGPAQECIAWRAAQHTEPARDSFEIRSHELLLHVVLNVLQSLNCISHGCTARGTSRIIPGLHLKRQQLRCCRRLGSETVKARVTLEVGGPPQRFRLSGALAGLLGTHSDCRAHAIQVQMCLRLFDCKWKNRSVRLGCEFSHLRDEPNVHLIAAPYTGSLRVHRPPQAAESR